ncbi:MAG: hypothetical protein ACYTEQ_00260 [Planctomycetota bacterium]|jgi:hypothetical protein
MNAATGSIEDKVDELLVILDEDIEHIQKSLLHLNELRSMVIKRDDAGLGELLERIRTESDNRIAGELKRRSMREELAAVLGCTFEHMTLSRLEEFLPEEKRAEVAQRKTTLKSLIAELKTEHLSTSLLLSECARFNRLLLRSILDLGRADALVYSADGTTSRQIDQTFVNLRF